MRPWHRTFATWSDSASAPGTQDHRPPENPGSRDPHIEGTAEREGRRFAMVIFPILLQLNESYPLNDVVDTLEQFCAQNGIPVRSLLPRFTGMDAPSLWVSKYDQHPNVRAHAVATDGIVEFVEELLARDRGTEPR